MQRAKDGEREGGAVAASVEGIDMLRVATFLRCQASCSPSREYLDLEQSDRGARGAAAAGRRRRARATCPSRARARYRYLDSATICRQQTNKHYIYDNKTH